MALVNYKEVDSFNWYGFYMGLSEDILSDGSIGYCVRIGNHPFPYASEKEAVEAFDEIKKILEKSL